MTQVHETMTLRASVDDVWSTIGGFNDLPQWHPAVVGSTLHEGGRVRRLVLADGASLIERLLTFSEEERSYGYSIEQGPLPVARYRSLLRAGAAEGGNGCRVSWSAEFVADGAPEAEAIRLISGIFRAGLERLAERFGRG